MKDNITIYTKPGCTYCDKLIEYLNLNEIAFDTKVYQLHFTKSEFLTMFGPNATFPQVVVNDNPIGGLRETVTYLVEKLSGPNDK